MLASDLIRRLNPTCPIANVSIGNLNDKSTWIVTPAASATAGQIAALPAAIAAIDPTIPAADEILNGLPFTPVELMALLLVAAGSPPAWASAVMTRAINVRKAALGSGIPTGVP